MSSPRLQLLPVLALLVVLAACRPQPNARRDGGEEPDGGTGPSKITAENGAQRFGDAICEMALRCGFVSGSLEDCRALILGSGDTFGSPKAAFDSVKAGKATFDPDKAEACEAAMRTARCDGDNAEAEATCDEVFEGLVPASGRCIADEACVRGTRCARDYSEEPGCNGTCVPLGEGECVSRRDCAAGLVCDEGKCGAERPPGKQGQPCGTFGRCEAGLYCSQDWRTGNSTCAPLPGEGQTCEWQCATGLICVPNSSFTSSNCRKPKKEAEQCVVPFECGGYNSPLVCSEGYCTRRPASGPCVLVETAWSVEGFCDETVARCDLSLQPPTCVPRGGRDAECWDDSDCEESLHCRWEGMGEGPGPGPGSGSGSGSGSGHDADGGMGGGWPPDGDDEEWPDGGHDWDGGDEWDGGWQPQSGTCQPRTAPVECVP